MKKVAANRIKKDAVENRVGELDCTALQSANVARLLGGRSFSSDIESLFFSGVLTPKDNPLNFSAVSLPFSELGIERGHTLVFLAGFTIISLPPFEYLKGPAWLSSGED